MPRFTVRDRVVVAGFLVGGGTVVVLALAGENSWAVAVLGVLAGLIGAAARFESTDHRSRVAKQELLARKAAESSDRALSVAGELRADLAAARRELAETRSDIAAEGAHVRRRLSRGMSTLTADNAQSRSELKSARRAVALKTTVIKEDIGDLRSDVASVARQGRRLAPELLNEIQALTQLFARYTPNVALPPIAGWALSPAGLLFLADAIERRGAELVVECGSGTSTLWMALAMRRRGAGKVIAVEHQEEYAEKTRGVLAAHGVSEWAEVRVSPLVDVSTPRGNFLWYDFDVNTLPRHIDLLLVDGPPGTTGRDARYPALPALAPVLAEKSLVVIDDADRADEREMVNFWAEEHAGLMEVASPGRGIRVFEARRVPR